MTYGIFAGYWAPGILSIPTYDSFQNLLFLCCLCYLLAWRALSRFTNSHAPRDTELTGQRGSSLTAMSLTRVLGSSGQQRMATWAG